MMFQFSAEEFRRILREPFRLFLLLAPWIALGVSLLVYSERVVREIPVGYVDQDQSSLSRTLIRGFDATPQIHLRKYFDSYELHKAFRTGAVHGGILIPNGLAEWTREGKTARVVVWRDASNPLYSNQVFQASSGVLAAEGAKLEAGRLIAVGASKELAMLLRVDSRPLGNPFIDYLRNMAPGLLPVFLQLCLMLAGGNLLPASWRDSPSPRKEFLGRALPWLVIQGTGAMVFLAFLFPYWGIPLESPIRIAALTALLMMASLSFGAALSRLLHNPLKTAQNLLAFNTPALLFSGYTFPEWAMPKAIEWATRPLPFSLFFDAYRGITGGMGARAGWGWFGLALYLTLSCTILFWPSRQRVLKPNKPHRDAPRNEFHRVFRTPGLAPLVVIAPIAYLILYGALFALKEESELPLAVTGALDSAMERQLLRSLNAHPRILVYRMEGDEAMQALETGVVRGILQVPEDLETQVMLRRSVSVPLLIPASRFLPVSDLQRACNEVFMDYNLVLRRDIFQAKGMSGNAAKQRADALILEDHPLFNPRETYGDFMLPGLGILILHQLMMIAMAFATAVALAFKSALWRRGVLYGLWFGIWVFLWIKIGLPIFDVPMDPNFGPLIVLTGLGLLCAGAIGAIIGMIFKNGIPVLQLVAFTSYPFFFISGASWPREAMPAWIDGLGQLLPLRPWILGSGRAIRMNANWSEVQVEILHLGVLALCYLSVAGLVWLRRRRGLAILSR